MSIKRSRRIALVLVITLLAALGGWALIAHAQGTASPYRAASAGVLSTAFTYQGQLQDNGSPASGTYDFEFALYDAATSGAQVGSTLTLDDVAVSEGLFTVQLDFGSGAFDGNARWMEIGVRPGSSAGAYTTLSPRQALTPTPYALYSLNGPFWQLTGNAGTDPATHFLGTTDAVTLTLKVSDTVALQLVPTAGTPNVIGGYSGNSVTAGVVGATIGGGGTISDPNSVTDNYATVGGGLSNTASGASATVGGGWSNTASGASATLGGGLSNTANGYIATVGGGYSNTASGYVATVGGGSSNTASNYWATVGGGLSNTASGYVATVGGGWSNTASGVVATVGGGWSNTASGDYATVPGGYDNTAAGNYSFAAGRRAQANNQGCFVWGDATDADVTCAIDNRTIFRSSGGFYIYTGSNPTTGAFLVAGSGTWSNLSDQNAKEHFAPVNPQAVLEQVAQLPITTWNYKTQDASIRHMGPMAQDFYAAFGLGSTDKGITTVDADGVALAAIQGLYQQNQALATENADLRARVQDLEQENAVQQTQIDELATRLAALEQAQGAGSAFQRQVGFPAWMGGLLLAGAGIVWAQRRRQDGQA